MASKFYSKLLMFILITMFAGAASAATPITSSDGNTLWYDLNDSLKSAYLVRPADGSSYEYPTVSIPESFINGEITYSVKEIAREAFKGSKALKEVSIPRTITSIGGHAFKDCLALATVNYNANNCRQAYDKRKGKMFSAFEDCNSITKINFGDDVTYIPEYLFWGCAGIAEITIPENVITISGAAFIDCSALTTLNFNAAKCVAMSSEISGRTMPAFINAPISVINFGEMVTNIPSFAFFGFKGLASITIPSQITKIGGSAFRECPNLTNVKFNAEACAVSHTVKGETILPPFNNPAITTVSFGDNVERIPDYLFWGCKGIQNLTLNSNITEIGASAFYGCAALTSVTIPEGVTVIKGRAFSACTNLSLVNFNALNCTNMTSLENDKLIPAFEKSAITQVVFGDNVKTIPDNAFANCVSLNTITIPNTVKYIGYKAFNKCTSLKTVTIPEGVVQIGGLAFEGCDKLTSLTFNAINCQGVTKEEDKKILSAFQSLTALKTVKFGNKVTVIPDYILAGCSGVNEVTIPRKVRAIGGNAFVGCSSLNSVIYNAENCNISFSNNEKSTRSAFTSESITNVSFGSGVKNIPDYLFAGCVRVANIQLPDSLESIGQYAFAECAAINDITIPLMTKRVKGGAFKGCVNIRDIYFDAINCESMHSIIDGKVVPAFESESVYNIMFGKKVENVPDYAFYNCVSVEDVVFSKVLKKIGKYAFANIYSLTYLEIPEQLEHLGGAAFMNCEQLETVRYNAINCSGAFQLSGDSILYPFVGKNKITDVVIGKKVERIPEGMFFNAKKLEMLTIPKKIQQLGAYSFGKCPLLKTLDFQAVGCENVSGMVNDTMRSAFDGCPKLSIITLNSKIEKLPDYMFQNCASLKRVELHEGLTRIGNYAFQNCKLMATVRFPMSLVAIGDGAFMGSGVRKISIHEGISEIGEAAFAKCPTLSMISVKKKNEDFFSDKGILYSSDTTRILAAPVRLAGKYIVRNAVATIDAYTFYNCKLITELVLPEALTYVGEKAFFYCNAVKKITVNAPSIPETPKAIFTDYIKNAELIVAVGSEGGYMRMDSNWRGFKKTSGNYNDKKKFK